MKSIEGFDFIALGFDSDGNLNNQPALDELNRERRT